MTEGAEVAELQLRAHLRVLSRRKKTIAVVILLIVASTLVASFLQTPVYEGEVRLLLQPREAEQLFDVAGEQAADPERAVQTEMEVVKSEPVRALVRERLGAVPKVAVRQVGDTDVIVLNARSTDRTRAGVITEAYALSYVEFRRAEAVADLRQAGRKIEAKIADLQRQVDALEARAVPGPRGVPLDPNLGERRDQLVAQQALFKQRLDELQVDAELKTGGARIVTRNPVPTSQVKPTPVRSGVVALVTGAMLGVALAFLVEYLDDSVKSKEDLQRAVAGVPVLGLIPTVEDWKEADRPHVVSLAAPKSPAAEAYRTLRTSLQFLGAERPPGIIQVTSGSAGEGKTSTLSNLGVALANAGQRVILVDCDLRRARLHQFFGLSNDIGFTSVFLGRATVRAAAQRVQGVDNLLVVASGPLPPNPSEVLSAKRTAEVMASLQKAFDVVLIDSPPVLPVADATALSAWVDATLVVASTGITKKKDLQRTVELLQQVGAPVVGTVLNRSRPEPGYQYQYGYETRAEAPDPRWEVEAGSDHRVGAPVEGGLAVDEGRALAGGWPAATAQDGQPARSRVPDSHAIQPYDLTEPKPEGRASSG